MIIRCLYFGQVVCSWLDENSLKKKALPTLLTIQTQGVGEKSGLNDLEQKRGLFVDEG